MYSVFLLLFIMAWGVTSRTGVLLQLYDAAAVNQYAWPKARVQLFVPLGVLLLGAALYSTWHIVCGPARPPWPVVNRQRLRLHMVDLMTLTALVGAISIWPSKIGVLYALFLAIALAAYCRLDLRLDAIAGETGFRSRG
jgi:hypothetical protein